MYNLNINSVNAVMRARGRMAPAGSRSIEQWLHRMHNHLDEAGRLALWGADREALAELVRALALGMCCLDEHLQEHVLELMALGNGNGSAKREVV